jgi:DNA-binding transcriptional regulator YhcF (GntR family)
MANKGWIKLHRSIIDWEWSEDNAVFSFFIKLLCLCNYEKKRWMGKHIEVGSFITSHEKLSGLLRMPVITVRRSLKKLEETGEIKVENLYKLGIKITIVKYRDYQNEQVNEQVSEQVNEQQLKKVKNKKNTL